VESAVKDQGADLRRFMVASLDSFATRIIGDLREAPVAAKPPPEPTPAPLPPPRRLLWPWALGAAAVASACAGLLVLWLQARDELAKSRAELAAANATNAELARAREELSATVKDLTTALAAAPAAGGTAGAGAGAVSSRSEVFPYGEAPLERGRVDALREMLVKLEAQGFRGTVKITSGAGVFCLSGNASDGYVPATPTLPLAKCDLLGNPADDSPAGQQRQSLAFANLVADISHRTGGAIAVSIESANKPAVPYPPRSDALTAGEWNKAALANNRVDFVAEPAAP
jgi:hypothetical protein